MQLETVSRVVSKLHRLGILDVQCREVVLLDLPALARLAQT
jgi:hypothetical protein